MNLSLRPLCLALLACGTFALQDAAQARPQKAQPAQVSAAASAPRGVTAPALEAASWESFRSFSMRRVRKPPS